MTSDAQPPPPQGGGHAAERLREQITRDLGETPDTQTERPTDSDADADTAAAYDEGADDVESPDEPDAPPPE